MSIKGKFGSPPNLTLRHLKKRWLSFEQKRQIAKLVIAGIPRKNICADLNISGACLSHIVRDFIVVTYAEKYPDDQQYAPSL